MRKIKVLGTGCTKCKKLYENVTKAIEDLEGYEVEKVSDIMKIMKYDVIQTPALVVDDKVVFSGNIPSVDEIKSILKGV